MKKMSEDEVLVKAWIDACSIRTAETIESLIVVVYDFIERSDEAKQAELKAFLLKALECRLLDLVARITVASTIDTGQTAGEAVGHFADHVMTADEEQRRRMNPLRGFLDEMFQKFDVEVTHHMAKRHSEGN